MMIIKAKPEYLEEIEVLLNEYREALMVKYKDRPQELGKVQASRIEVIPPSIFYAVCIGIRYLFLPAGTY